MNDIDDGSGIDESEAGNFEVNFSGKTKIEANDGGEAIIEVATILRNAGFIVEDVRAYKLDN
jgi:hypothetical protein